MQVIVCAGGEDETADIARQFEKEHPGKILVLDQMPGDSKQGALRRSFEKSVGEIIYLTDADCIVPSETLKTLVTAVGPHGADAATGFACPVLEQRSLPWIRHQWATAWANDRGRSGKSTGLHGRNCAVRREAIEAAGAFEEHVKIGTDYHLAKKLISVGRCINFVPVAVQTLYAEDFASYSSQQSRWMRNILIHGPRFGDIAEVRGVIRSISLGISLLVWPLSWRWTRIPGVALWLIPLGWMTLVRVKQQEKLECEFDLESDNAKIGRAALHSLADLVIWARPALDLLISSRRQRW